MGPALLALCNVIRDMSVHRHVEWKTILAMVKAFDINKTVEQDASETLQLMLRAIQAYASLSPQHSAVRESVTQLEIRLVHQVTCATSGCGYSSMTSDISMAIVEVNVKVCFSHRFLNAYVHLSQMTTILN
jgi:hypothetical protein